MIHPIMKRRSSDMIFLHMIRKQNKHCAFLSLSDCVEGREKRETARKRLMDCIYTVTSCWNTSSSLDIVCRYSEKNWYEQKEKKKRTISAMPYLLAFETTDSRERGKIEERRLVSFSDPIPLHPCFSFFFSPAFLSPMKNLGNKGGKSRTVFIWNAKHGAETQNCVPLGFNVFPFFFRCRDFFSCCLLEYQMGTKSRAKRDPALTSLEENCLLESCCHF